MEENVFRQIEKRVEDIEKKYGSLERYVIETTIFGEDHTMRMEEEYYSFYKENWQVYQELADLELADLLDFQKLAGLIDGEFS